MKQGIHPNYVDCTITCACRVDRFNRRFGRK